MAKFKVGDKFRAKDDIGNSWRTDKPYFTKGEVYEIGKVDSYESDEDHYEMTDDEERDPLKAKHGADNNWLDAKFEFLTLGGPIRTVTRREIVPGYIELPNGTSMYIDTQDGEVSVDLDELWLDADSLREAAHLFNQLAEVLDEQAVGGKPAATVVAKPEWIEWPGGQCPVDEATNVEVTYDNEIDRGEAWRFAWNHSGNADITAYRILPCAN